MQTLLVSSVVLVAGHQSAVTTLVVMLFLTVTPPSHRGGALLIHTHHTALGTIPQKRKPQQMHAPHSLARFLSGPAFMGWVRWHRASGRARSAKQGDKVSRPAHYA